MGFFPISCSVRIHSVNVCDVRKTHTIHTFTYTYLNWDLRNNVKLNYMRTELRSRVLCCADEKPSQSASQPFMQIHPPKRIYNTFMLCAMHINLEYTLALAHVQFPVHISMVELRAIKKKQYLIFDFYAPHSPGFIYMHHMVKFTATKKMSESEKKKTIIRFTVIDSVISCVTHFGERHFIVWRCLMVVIVILARCFLPSVRPFSFPVQWNHKNHCSLSFISFVYKLIGWFDLINSATTPTMGHTFSILNIWREINSIWAAVPAAWTFIFRLCNVP